MTAMSLSLRYTFVCEFWRDVETDLPTPTADNVHVYSCDLYDFWILRPCCIQILHCVNETFSFVRCGLANSYFYLASIYRRFWSETAPLCLFSITGDVSSEGIFIPNIYPDSMKRLLNV